MKDQPHYITQPFASALDDNGSTIMTVQKSYVSHIAVMTNGLAVFASAIYLPSLPIIAHDLQASASSTQDTVALNFLGMSLANLVYGPLSDVYGRRVMMLLGFALFCLFSLGCALAGDINSLTIYRFIAGCGAGVALSLSMTMVNDLHAGIQAAQTLAKMAAVIVIAPAVAPLFGGYLAVLFGWRSIFIVCFALGAATWLLMWLKLPETAPQPLKRSFSMTHALKNYWRALKSRSFMGYVFAQGALFAGLWAYQTVAPFILISQIGIPTEHYGFYAGSISLCHGLGSAAAHRLARAHGNAFLLQSGFWGALLSSVLLASITYLYPESAILLTLMVGLYSAMIAFVLPPAITQSMKIMASHRGTASAVLISARMGLVFIGSMYGGWLSRENFMPVALWMGAFAILALIILGLSTDDLTEDSY